MENLTDDSILHYGQKHRGKKLAEVPDSYLVWLYDNAKISAVLKTYIEENVPLIQAQVRARNTDDPNQKHPIVQQRTGHDQKKS